MNLMNAFEGTKNFEGLLEAMVELFESMEFYPIEIDDLYDDFQKKSRTTIARLLSEPSIGLENLKKINSLLLRHFPEETRWLSMLA